MKYNKNTLWRSIELLTNKQKFHGDDFLNLSILYSAYKGAGGLREEVKVKKGKISVSSMLDSFRWRLPQNERARYIQACDSVKNVFSTFEKLSMNHCDEDHIKSDINKAITNLNKLYSDSYIKIQGIKSIMVNSLGRMYLEVTMFDKRSMRTYSRNISNVNADEFVCLEVAHLFSASSGEKNITEEELYKELLKALKMIYSALEVWRG